MLENYCRPLLQRYTVEPIARRLVTVSPLHITLFAGFIGLCVPILLGMGAVWLALVFLWISGYADVVDGSVARLAKASSPFGTVLDILTDRTVEAAVVIGLCLINPPERALLGLCMMAAMLLCVSSFLVVGIFSDNTSEKSFHYSPGLMERAEAFIFFSAMMLLPAYFTPLAVLFIALVLWTAAKRVWEFKGSAH